MEMTAIDIYIKNTKLIKLRTEVVRRILSGELHTLYKATSTETAALQVRFILEHIAMASLAVNKEKYAEARSCFARDWKAVEILKQLKKINPDFYPIPITETSSEKVDIVNELQVKTGGFLSTEDFVQAYDYCSNILHADNPYGETTDYETAENKLRNWCNLIIGLLNSHKIVLVDDPDTFYLIHMHEDRDDEIHYYTFAKK